MIHIEDTAFGKLRVLLGDENISVQALDGRLPLGTVGADLIPCFFITDALEEPGCWWIARLVVRPQHRGKGIGSLLITRLKEAVAQNACKLAVVAPSGYVSGEEAERRQVAFYLKHGFVDVPKEPGLLRYDAV